MTKFEEELHRRINERKLVITTAQASDVATTSFWQFVIELQVYEDMLKLFKAERSQ